MADKERVALKTLTFDDSDTIYEIHDEIARNSLANKQDIISDINAIRNGATAGTTAYQKPKTGIPKTDLNNDIQTSLEKADTALQEHQPLTDYIKSTDYATSNTSGVIKTGNGLEVISNGTNAGTAYAITRTKEQFDDENDDLFISKGTLSNVLDANNYITQIKTINNQSLIGEGNIEIQGGSGTGGADIDLSNLSDLGNLKFDGDIIGKTVDLQVNVVYSGNAKQTISLADYLPDDNYIYMIVGNVCTLNSTSTETSLGAISDIITSGLYRIANATKNSTASTPFVHYIGPERTLTMQNLGTSQVTVQHFRIFAYRRLGEQQ